MAFIRLKGNNSPLQLSAAKTVHKAQGSTLSEAAVHFGTRKFDHMHYVGLSRVTCLKQLKILNLNENKISVSQLVLEEMKRLREKFKFQVCIKSSLDCQSNEFSFVFFNIRSLHRHFIDLKGDESILSSDVIFISETRLIPNDCDSDFQLRVFELHQSDFPVHGIERSGYGLAVYVKQSISCKIASLFWIKYKFCLSI